jgi:hypothetical protein
MVLQRLVSRLEFFEAGGRDFTRNHIKSRVPPVRRPQQTISVRWGEGTGLCPWGGSDRSRRTCGCSSKAPNPQPRAPQFIDRLLVHEWERINSPRASLIPNPRSLALPFRTSARSPFYARFSRRLSRSQQTPAPPYNFRLATACPKFAVLSAILLY